METEFLAPDGLAEKWDTTREWVMRRTRMKEDAIPHYRLGKLIRYAWGSAELNAWIQRHMVSRPPTAVTRKQHAVSR